MLGVHVVIPQKLQSKVLEELHCNHPGIVRMKSLARSYCWWSHMDQHIEALVQAYLPCQSTRNAPSASPVKHGCIITLILPTLFIRRYLCL